MQGSWCGSPPRLRRVVSTRWWRATNDTVAAWPFGFPHLRHQPTLPSCSKLVECAAKSTFPAMLRTLRPAASSQSTPAGLVIRRVGDVAEYEKVPYPAIGPTTTPLRRVAFERLRALLTERGGRTRAFVAWLKDEPVGAIELFQGLRDGGDSGALRVGPLPGSRDRIRADRTRLQGCRRPRRKGDCAAGDD